MQGKRSGFHAIQTPHRSHPGVRQRCRTGWNASPNERNRTRRKFSTTSSRCSTISCGQSRKGNFKLKRKTSGKKFRVKHSEMRLWFHHQLSTPIGELWPILNAKLRGHYQYYGIKVNWPMLMAFRNKVRRMAKRHLSRRGQTSYVNWGDFNCLTEHHPLAAPKRLKDLIAMQRRLSAGGR